MYRLPIAAALAVVTAAAGLGYPMLVHGDEPKPRDPFATAKVAVTTTKVVRGDVAIEQSGLGRVQAFNDVTVRTQVEGQIESIDYRQGQDVKQGDLLVQIDPRIYQARLDQDVAALARDRAHLANAIANLNRYTPLAHNGFASAQQVETQQAMVAQIEATLKLDQAVIEQDQVQLGYTRITAPIAGVAGLRLVDQGNVVHPTDATGLVSLTQVQPIAVLFTLPQAELAEIQTRMAQANASGLTVEAWSQDGATKLDTGNLETIDNKVDAASGTITLRADFPNAKRLLWPGEFVEARLITDVQHDALSVPAPVIQRGNGGTYAWVVQSDGTAATRAVTVGQLQHGTALVTSGLNAGETVVTDGQYALQPGVQVAERRPGEGGAALKNAQTDMLGIVP
jgi:multidrug efflux system membrane fusion protein